jgi:hypothetical protein
MLQVCNAKHPVSAAQTGQLQSHPLLNNKRFNTTTLHAAGLWTVMRRG